MKLTTMIKNIMMKVIPISGSSTSWQAFKIKNNLPGNKNKNQKQLESVSWDSIKDEKKRFVRDLNNAKRNVEKAKDDLKVLVNVEAFRSDMKRLEKHLKFVRKKRGEKIDKKFLLESSVLPIYFIILKSSFRFQFGHQGEGECRIKLSFTGS